LHIVNADVSDDYILLSSRYTWSKLYYIVTVSTISMPPCHCYWLLFYCYIFIVIVSPSIVIHSVTLKQNLIVFCFLSVVQSLVHPNHNPNHNPNIVQLFSHVSSHDVWTVFGYTRFSQQNYFMNMKWLWTINRIM